MIIYGKERQLIWKEDLPGEFWVCAGDVWGGGSTRENALAELIDHIEYIESGSYDRAHESWCEFTRERP